VIKITCKNRPNWTLENVYSLASTGEVESRGGLTRGIFQQKDQLKIGNKNRLKFWYIIFLQLYRFLIDVAKTLMIYFLNIIYISGFIKFSNFIMKWYKILLIFTIFIILLNSCFRTHKIILWHILYLFRLVIDRK
jgi:hypothetical protein